MKNKTLLLSVLVLLAAGCGNQAADPAAPAKSRQVFTQQELEKMVGYEVTVEGKAVDSPAGPAVQAAKYVVFVDGISRWPAGQAGQEVKVRGMLQRRPSPGASKARPQDTPYADAPAESQLVLKDPKW